jgi:hypothetical protein
MQLLKPCRKQGSQAWKKQKNTCRPLAVAGLAATSSSPENCAKPLFLASRPIHPLPVEPYRLPIMTPWTASSTSCWLDLFVPLAFLGDAPRRADD